MPHFLASEGAKKINKKIKLIVVVVVGAYNLILHIPIVDKTGCLLTSITLLYRMTVSQAQVSTQRGIDKLLVFNWSQAQLLVFFLQWLQANCLK